MEPGERRHEQGAGNDEERAGEQSACHPALPPAGVGGQLLCLRSRQEHAEPHRGEKFFFLEPLATFHHLAVQDGDLPGRAAKARGADHEPSFPGSGRHPALLCVGGTLSSDIRTRRLCRSRQKRATIALSPISLTQTGLETARGPSAPWHGIPSEAVESIMGSKVGGRLKDCPASSACTNSPQSVGVAAVSGRSHRGLLRYEPPIRSEPAPGGGARPCAHDDLRTGSGSRSAGGGGQSGLIHWITAAQPALSGSCCR